jgi:hypothetical protein
VGYGSYTIPLGAIFLTSLQMTLAEITSWFSQIDKIIFDLNISVNYARRLFENKLDSQREIIKKVITSRDTLYAHRDKDALPQNVTLDDVAILIDLSVEVFNSLRGGIFDIHTDMTRTTDWSID